MAKLIILSVVIVSFVVPIMMCTGPKPREALRRAQWTVLAFIVLWAFMCTHWYPNLVDLK